MFHNSGKPTVVFVSAENARSDQATNAKLTDSLRQTLDSFQMNWVPTLGSYRGTIEASNMIVLEHPQQLDRVLDLARTFGQESIMVRNSDESVELHYISGQVHRIPGKLTEIPAAEASKLDAWTRVGDTYWAVK